ncbi:MAG TPA: aminoacyl-tRNA hydrolase [Saprospiraceae bacterium]|jgi:peptidyl-tRNA hydrolase, PTH1 family
MKYLIVGLGNIGAEYAETRHNIGFKVVEELAASLEGTWKNATLGSIAEVKHKGRTLILLKPNTYMNLSGKAVNYWLQKEKIPVENLLVILDEIQLDLGTIRLRGKGTDGGHNGLKDIQLQLNSTEYARLRIGVGKNFHPGQQVNYVLGKWSSEETKVLQDVLKAGADAVKTFVSIGLKRAMDQVNATAKQIKPDKP